MALKPAGKAVVIVAILGAAGFGVDKYLDSRPAKISDVPQKIERELEPLRSQPKSQVQREEPQSDPQVQSELETPSSTPSNSGMDALLKRRK